MRPSFRLHPEQDKDIIELLRSIPIKERSDRIREWIRNGASDVLRIKKYSLSRDTKEKSDRNSEVIKWNFPK